MLIVDDESIIVEGIRDSISWEDYGVEVVATAGNGLEALDCCRSYLPDIIIADIKMPEMDGLAFIEEARKIVPSAQNIIISAFEQFAYAQRAIELGVNFYLVKPIKPRDIIDKVRLCVEALEESDREISAHRKIMEENQRNHLFVAGYTIACWLDGITISEQRLYEGFGRFGFPLGRPWYGLMVLRPDWSSAKMRPDAALEVLQSRLKAAISRTIEYVPIQNQFTELVCLYTSFAQPDETRKMLTDAYERVSTELYRDYRARLNCEMSAQEHDIQKCPALYANLARRGSQTPYVSGNGLGSTVFLTYRESLALGDRKRAAYILEHEIHNKIAAQGNSLETVRFAYAQLISVALWALHEQGTPMKHVLQDEDLHLQLMQKRSADEMYCWFSDIQTRILNITSGDREEIGKRIIRDARNYIESRPLGSLSLDEVAEHAALSSSYFSKLFKREMGISFIDYLKKLRIESAKHMLRHTNRKVYEICAELGYKSVQYFTTMFKESVGMTPLEYRESEYPSKAML